jgi:hypothetical protein
MPSFTITKDRISSPLEAGTSLLDNKQFPPQLINALDYVSGKLARRRLHLSLIVVRRETEIPSFPSPQQSPKTPVSPNPYGLTLMHASTLTEKAAKILRHTIAKAEKKFNIGYVVASFPSRLSILLLTRLTQFWVVTSRVNLIHSTYNPQK